MSETPAETINNAPPVFWDIRQDILRQALPDYPDRMDLTVLNRLEPDLASFFVDKFQKGIGFQKEVEADFEIDQKLQHLYFQSRSILRTEGLKSFGLGFPLFMASKNGELVVAPLFIWRMNLAPRFDKASSWFLSSKGQPEVDANPFLVNYIKRHYDLDTGDSFYEILKDGTVTATEVADFCSELSEKLELSHPGQQVAIAPFPNMGEVDQLAVDENIQWSGVLGIYPPLPESFGGLVAEGLLKPGKVSSGGHPFGLPGVDPYQASVKKALTLHRVVLVEGSSGTGKGHLLTHLLTNTLSNGKKALVISGSMESLKGAQLGLSKLGISQFNFLLKDPVHDKGLLLELLRAAAEGGMVPVNHNEEYFQIVLDKCRREHQKLEERYQAVRQEVFDGYDWTDTVGLFLASNKVEGKELLSNQLNVQDFKLDDVEFHELTTAIENAKPLYQKIKTLKHPLQQLNAGIFIHHSKEEGLAFIKKQIHHFHEKGTELQHRYITKINLYSEELLAHYENYYSDLARRVQELKDKIADYTSQYGADFERQGSLFFGLFSEKQRDIRDSKEELSGMYRKLVEAFEKVSYFDFKFSRPKQGKSTSRIKDNVESFSISLEKWQNGIHPLVQEEVLRLNQKTAHPGLDFKDHISEIEGALDLFIEELNGSGLYQLPLENKMLTLSKRQKYLEEILEKLENSQLNLRDYNAFYDWQSNWFGMNETARKVIRALIKVKPINWAVAFRSWYLNHCLTGKSLPVLPVNDHDLNQFYAEYNKLRPLMVPQVSYLWQGRKESYLKKFRRENKPIFNQVFGRKNQEISKELSLKVVLENSFEAITEVLPVFFAPPHLADNLIPKQEGLFDYVFVYEAQFLAFIQVAPLLALGKQIVIITDPDQEQIDKDWTLPAMARANGARVVPLKTVHRWSPGNLLQLNNVNGISEQAVDTFEMHFAQVDGRFNEQTGTNDVEAQEVIRLLNEVKKTPQRTYPSVGIVCFTGEQRDLISNYLLQIKRQRKQGAEKIQQLERNGLGIYLADDIHGQRFEVLIVSGTFGPVDLDRQLCRAFASLDESTGRQKINLLLSRAKKEIFIINSIPEVDLEDLLTDTQKPGRFMLANYYAYAKAIEEEDTHTQQSIAQRLLEWQPSKALIQPYSAFLKELAKSMESYLEPGRILLNHHIGPVYFPLLIQPVHSDESPIAIWPDGFFAQTPATDFIWEYQRRLQLKELGYHFLPVWSAKWWKNPRQEARRLSTMIIDHDNEYLEE